VNNSNPAKPVPIRMKVDGSGANNAAVAKMSVDVFPAYIQLVVKLLNTSLWLLNGVLKY